MKMDIFAALGETYTNTRQCVLNAVFMSANEDLLQLLQVYM